MNDTHGETCKGAMTAVKRRALVALPAKAKDLENALRDARDAGQWEGEVQLVLDKNINQYRLELVTTDELQMKLNIEETR